MAGGRLKQSFQPRRKVIALGILLVGLAAGLFIYLTASPPDDALREQMEATKEYERQMEMYGGTANVLASQIREWFAALWQGPTLGITVACLSAVLALVVFVVLIPLPRVPGADGEHRDGA